MFGQGASRAAPSPALAHGGGLNVTIDWRVPIKLRCLSFPLMALLAEGMFFADNSVLRWGTMCVNGSVRSDATGDVTGDATTAVCVR